MGAGPNPYFAAICALPAGGTYIACNVAGSSLSPRIARCIASSARKEARRTAAAAGAIAASSPSIPVSRWACLPVYLPAEEGRHIGAVCLYRFGHFAGCAVRVGCEALPASAARAVERPGEPAAARVDHGANLGSGHCHLLVSEPVQAGHSPYRDAERKRQALGRADTDAHPAERTRPRRHDHAAEIVSAARSVSDIRRWMLGSSWVVCSRPDSHDCSARRPARACRARCSPCRSRCRLPGRRPE